MVSHAMEDYIAVIWRLTLHGGVATTGEVARQLGVTAASASYMFKKMAEENLVEHKEYAGVTLTARGERAAAGYIRKHRLTERFLVDILGIPWDQVDAIADQMEHSLPEIVIDRFDALLGHPLTCPHGYPIPDKDGHLPEIPVRPLAELQPGEHGVVARVSEHDPRLLAYLAELKLVPGEQVEMAARDAVGETYTVQVAGARHTVGPNVARAVFTRR